MLGNIYVGQLNSPEEIIRRLMDVTNVNSYVAFKKAAEVFGTNGKNRFSAELKSTKYVSLEAIEDFEASPDWNKFLINNIDTPYIVKQIMENVSQMTSYERKLSVMMHFIEKGIGYSFQEEFHLLTESPKFGEPLSDEVLKDNKLINDMVGEFYQEYYKKGVVAQELFFQYVKKTLGDEPAELIKDSREWILDESTGNIYRALHPYMKKKKLEIEFREELKNLRKIVGYLLRPTISDLCTYFDISKDSYREEKLAGITSLVNTLGDELLSKVG